MATPSDAVREAVHARISDALTDVGIVGRWALVAEVIDMDGRTSVLTVPAPGLAAWECMGLHGHAQALAKEASIQ